MRRAAEGPSSVTDLIKQIKETLPKGSQTISPEKFEEAMSKITDMVSTFVNGKSSKSPELKALASFVKTMQFEDGIPAIKNEGSSIENSRGATTKSLGDLRDKLTATVNADTNTASAKAVNALKSAFAALRKHDNESPTPPSPGKSGG